MFRDDLVAARADNVLRGTKEVRIHICAGVASRSPNGLLAG